MRLAKNKHSNRAVDDDAIHRGSRSTAVRIFVVVVVVILDDCSARLPLTSLLLLLKE